MFQIFNGYHTSASSQNGWCFPRTMTAMIDYQGRCSGFVNQYTTRVDTHTHTCTVFGPEIVLLPSLFWQHRLRSQTASSSGWDRLWLITMIVVVVVHWQWWWRWWWWRWWWKWWRWWRWWRWRRRRRLWWCWIWWSLWSLWSSFCHHRHCRCCHHQYHLYTLFFLQRIRMLFSITVITVALHYRSLIWLMALVSGENIIIIFIYTTYTILESGFFPFGIAMSLWVKPLVPVPKVKLLDSWDPPRRLSEFGSSPPPGVFAQGNMVGKPLEYRGGSQGFQGFRKNNRV